MIWWITLLVTLIYYAKPIYWLGKIVYLKWTDSNMIKHPLNTDEIARYKGNLTNWSSQTWALVKWNKGDV